MELREYIKILKKNLGLIVTSTIMVALFAFIFTSRQTTIYEADGSLTIVPKPVVELKNVYEYNGYYALQSSISFGNTIIAWMQSPDVVIEIYKKAGYEVGGQSSKALSKFIKPTLLPDSFSLKFQLKDKEKDKSQKLATATIEVVKSKIEEFNQTRAGAKTAFELTSSEPIILEIKPKKEFNTAVGALVGLVLGIFSAFVLEYFRKS